MVEIFLWNIIKGMGIAAYSNTSIYKLNTEKWLISQEKLEYIKYVKLISFDLYHVTLF